ncbi:DEAD/DEAH box helicase [Halolamina litorea]|uniref:DEAD/DEAH box helicase n=1 Tax=Halolamina litorea TaxID=1515593 RepID=A0ABD6BR90_9EURY|nr:DEAD/DEAH box helicase [Halolamina litorea]
MENAGVDAFTHLGPAVRAALSERGFTTPTEPQRRAIPPLAAGDHALVIAPTGTGKTETAMLPVLDQIAAAEERHGISALYITPLRALNRDMLERLEWWGETLDLEVDVRHGDTTDYQRSKQANDPPDVLITTPETVQAMLTGKKLRKALSDVQHLVIDEVHELAASKRGAQLTIAMERVQELSGPFQRIGLSATVGDPDEVAKFLTGSVRGEERTDRDYRIVEVDAGSKVDLSVVSPEITSADKRLAGELATEPEIASHVRFIRDVVAENESTLVFVNTRQTAEALGARFKSLDAPIGIHHGSLSKEARIEVEEDFKAGEIDGLVCTSSMELGIDVGRVNHVVQYGSPREVARLLQRVGRAGHRRGQVSHGTVVVSDADDAAEAMVIARRAKAGDVEPAGIHEGSLDVLANQIVGLLMDQSEIDAREAYERITRAYPFRDLPEETFREVVRELSSNRLLWLEEDHDRIESSGGTWQYYYANLSMIPDEESYEVYDVSSRRGIGSLDERFVVNFAEPGSVFVQRGEMWRVDRVDEDEERVEVSPVQDPGGEVPTWVGSEIPVPAAVANEVGELREIAGRQFANGAGLSAVASDFTSRYPVDAATAEVALDPVERQVDVEAPVPTANRLVLESQGRTVVLNSPYGHQVNETLGRICSALVGQRTGSSVGMEVDPYRVEFEVPSGVGIAEFHDVLLETDPSHVEAILELALKNADALKFTLSHVAAKFGALKRYQGRGRFGGDRLLAALSDTPVYDEALRQVFHEDLALTETRDLLSELQADDGDVELATARERTPIGAGGRSAGGEFLVPEGADASVIQTVRDRLEGDRVLLFCVHCKDWNRRQEVGKIREPIKCPKCGSTRIAALNPWADEVVKATRAEEKDDEQDRMTRKAFKSANLVQEHGMKAVRALAARGVGPQTAARIISKFREDEADFYRDILEQERQYARTKSFW